MQKSTDVKVQIDLSQIKDFKDISNRVKEDINCHTAVIYDDGFRWHLGASKIGDECKRALWYGFRWIGSRKPDGRMQRLFNRGHLEEFRHAEWLKGIGFQIWTHDESIVKADGTHPQLRIKNKCKGHLGGSLDGIVGFPSSYNIPNYLVLESKTSGTGATFNKLDKEGMALARPAHYIQNSIYGYDYGIEHALYICANKNDDDLYIEIVKLNFNLAKQMEAKADSIIFSQIPPERISETPNFFTCKSLCEFKDNCFGGKAAVKNCRSCEYCSAVDSAEFYCSKENGIIPRDFVKTGCDNWKSITNVMHEKISIVTKQDFKIPIKTVGSFEIKSGEIPY